MAFLDAWNIGANDAANSWATSVASRSIRLWQACILGSIMEFAGAYVCPIWPSLEEHMLGLILTMTVF